MSTFKVGDKVVSTQEDAPYLYVKQGSTYTVSAVRTSGSIVLAEIAEPHNYGQRYFELVRDPVLTPEEVFKHLQLCTKLQFAIGSQWYDHSGNTVDIKVSELISTKWRIKPAPEIIEANGRKYKLIEE